MNSTASQSVGYRFDYWVFGRQFFRIWQGAGESVTCGLAMVVVLAGWNGGRPHITVMSFSPSSS